MKLYYLEILGLQRGNLHGTLATLLSKLPSNVADTDWNTQAAKCLEICNAYHDTNFVTRTVYKISWFRECNVYQGFKILKKHEMLDDNFCALLQNEVPNYAFVFALKYLNELNISQPGIFTQPLLTLFQKLDTVNLDRLKQILENPQSRKLLAPVYGQLNAKPNAPEYIGAIAILDKYLTQRLLEIILHSTTPVILAEILFTISNKGLDTEDYLAKIKAHTNLNGIKEMLSLYGSCRTMTPQQFDQALTVAELPAGALQTEEILKIMTNLSNSHGTHPAAQDLAQTYSGGPAAMWS